MAIELKIKQISIKRLLNNIDKAQEQLIQEVEDDTKKFVPAKTLELTNKTRILDNNKTLVYTKPYAHYQYIGKLRTDDRGRAWVKKGEKKPVLHTGTPLVYSKDIHPQATSHWFEEAKKINKDKWIRKAAEVIKNGE